MGAYYLLEPAGQISWIQLSIITLRPARLTRRTFFPVNDLNESDGFRENSWKKIIFKITLPAGQFWLLEGTLSILFLLPSRSLL